ncbi:hypothetical protein JDN40_12475 [Rhodomicrobium vannielii ATCC 17100]|uniref:hypothetical protein n=1 Tax=Rhodomicrobium vannielii TaxID=1069 RepID=UPI001919F57F|nr:hypothetical protein [Rhodomicrobium vannielii]MBJ7534922.1 hypothetical protein [Rhodomicrobium vannielii ATCC 17100]
MRGIARIAREMGDGDIRLTVWQNLLISGVPEAKTAEVEVAIEAIGLRTRATAIRAGLVTCTGSTGCRFAATDTKEHAEAIAAWTETRVIMDTPINIHITGCRNSCAQHYIGDIGLVGVRVALSDEGDTVEAYHLFAGGAFGPDACIGREIVKNVIPKDVPRVIKQLLRYYLTNREGASETFATFARRTDIALLQAAARIDMD